MIRGDLTLKNRESLPQAYSPTMEILRTPKSYLPQGIVFISDLSESEVEEWWGKIEKSVKTALQKKAKGDVFSVSLPGCDTPPELKKMLFDMFDNVNSGVGPFGYEEALLALAIVGDTYGDKEFSEITVNQYTKSFFDGTDGLLKQMTYKAGNSRVRRYYESPWTQATALMVTRFIVCGKLIPGIPHDKLYGYLADGAKKKDHGFSFWVSDKIKALQTGSRTVDWP